MKKLTPAQQQYMWLKQQHEDALLFFRMWDFYEVFYWDAKIAHDVLWITLTARDKKSESPIPMAWIPYHSLEKYTPKLLAAWYKIAIAEQVWAPKKWSIVERKVVEVLTPWTVVWDTIHSLHILSVTYTDAYCMAWWDVSLWTYMTKRCDTYKETLLHIEHIMPKEVIIDIDFPEIDILRSSLHIHAILVSVHEVPHDAPWIVQHILWVQSLDWFGVALIWWNTNALALLFSYIEHVQHRTVSPVYAVHASLAEDIVLFDDITRDNLEIFSSRYNGSRVHSLYDVIHVTRTPMWSRLLYDRLAHPIRDKNQIQQRLWYVERYITQDTKRNEILSFLWWIVDLQRLCTRIITKVPSPLAMQQLLFVYDKLFSWTYASLLHSELLHVWCDEKVYSEVLEVYTYIKKIITDDPIEWWIYYICAWYDIDIDKYRQLVLHADDVLLSYQKDLQSYTWWVPVKIKRIKNQWYMLEVTPKDISRFEELAQVWSHMYDFVRGQTLKWWQRYITPYLREIEEKITTGKELLIEKEMQLLQDLISYIWEHMHACISLAEHIASLDISASFAELHDVRCWCIPELHDKKTMYIREWRHPVVEHFLPKDEVFIPNDLTTTNDAYFHIITWPNMWWKSTYLRQQALILLLAHAWLPVPATEAKLPIIDALFARIGAGDALAKNQSTFMTEMLETANILHNATDHSFILLDELWRGTSTYDGLALAKAISVYICQDIKAITLFATHYHELTDLEDSLQWCKNYQVSVYESHQDVVFLKKVVSWKASKSYGIDVAKLAWIPRDVIGAAESYLRIFEAGDNKVAVPVQQWFDFGVIEDVSQIAYDLIKRRLKNVSLNDLTPIESLLVLQDIIGFMDDEA